MDAARIPDALDALAAKLAALGVRATTDRRDMNLPAALVELDSVTYPVLCGGGDPLAAVELLAGDVGAPTSIRQLTTMLAAAEQLGGFTEARTTFAPNGSVLGIRFTIPLERFAP